MSNTVITKHYGSIQCWMREEEKTFSRSTTPKTDKSDQNIRNLKLFLNIRSHDEVKSLSYFQDINKIKSKLHSTRNPFKLRGWTMAFCCLVQGREKENVGEHKAAAKPLFCPSHSARWKGQQLWSICTMIKKSKRL